MSRRDRMEVVARVMRLREDRARAEDVRAQRAEAAAGERVEDARGNIAGQLPTRGSTLPPVQLLSLHLRGIRATELIELAEEEHERSVHEHRQASRALRRANRERQSVERLAERRQQQAAIAARIRAERSLDEMAVLRRKGGDA